MERTEERKVLVKKTAADVIPVSLLSGVLAISVFFRGQCNTGALRIRRVLLEGYLARPLFGT